MKQSRLRARLTPIVAALAVFVVAACGGGGGDPAQTLADAFETSFQESFAFDATVTAEGAAREEILADAPEAGAVLDSLRLAGRVGGGTFAVSVGQEGSELLQLLWPDDNTLYIQGSLDALAQLGGEEMPDPQQLLGALQQAQLPPQLVDVATALVQGEWVGIVLPEDMSEGATGALPMPVDPAEAQKLGEAFQERYEEPEEFINEFIEIEETEADGARRFDLTVRAKALVTELQQIAEEANSTAMDPADLDPSEVPETVTGISVTVADDVVTQVQVDVLEIGRSSGEEDVPEGSFLVTTNFSDHGTIEPVSAPDGAVTIPVEELVQLVFGLFLGAGLGG